MDQNVADLIDSLPTGPVLRTFMTYSFIFYSSLEVAIDVKSGVAVEHVGLDSSVKCGYSRSNGY